MHPPILSDILRFVRECDALEPQDQAETFDELAGRALTWQVPRVEPLRRLWASAGLDPHELDLDWRSAPPVPTRCFATEVLAAAPAATVFRSSGTTRGKTSRSQHHVPFPELYEAILDASFEPSCVPPTENPFSVLSLVPSAALLSDSSLSYMASHTLAALPGQNVSWVLGADGLDAKAALRWLETQEAAARPALIFSTAFALLELLDQLPRAFQLAPGSVIFETGGFKGRTREVTRSDLVDLVMERLDVPAERIVREYGMSELSSQCYSRVLSGGDPDLLFPPPWMRFRVLDPRDMSVCPDGEPGVLSFFDLGNVGSSLAVLSEDLGVSEGRGFRLLGRVEGSPLRGCSLTAEEFVVAGENFGA